MEEKNQRGKSGECAWIVGLKFVTFCLETTSSGAFCGSFLKKKTFILPVQPKILCGSTSLVTQLLSAVASELTDNV